jgi:hypothetical protein
MWRSTIMLDMKEGCFSEASVTLYHAKLCHETYDHILKSPSVEFCCTVQAYACQSVVHYTDCWKVRVQTANLEGTDLIRESNTEVHVRLSVSWKF